ncbi:HD domain-containing phosphohydrolase [Alishewanella tabrizica]|uniref:Two-component system response regulator n=1 Tax=Alishewanella tabrizica TaxID=671278 RepID=A0ABQ2WHM4_9ALTE|nr:HD domain-containing phosphohydrolase [Alishewanella tabrizica]GGW56931.1 two-component system response regulator [Alishewanella tabrizica]
MTVTENHPTLLCVDDEISILKALTRVFAAKPVRLLQANSGKAALAILQQESVHLIISDMRMPEMTGAELLAQAAVMQPDAYRILMTGYADLSSTISAINIGKIHRYVQKPWDNQELLDIVDEGIKYFLLVRNNKLLTQKISRQNKELKTLNHNLEEIVQQRTQQLKKLLRQLKANLETLDKDHKALLEVLYNIISINPQLSGEFALNVANTCRSLARTLELSREQQQRCYQAGLFSELGKVSLPPNLLQSPFYKLDNHERQLYLLHPQQAEDILHPAGHLLPVAEIIAQQFERFNGSGVPSQRIGTDIILGARILAVARDYWGHLLQRLQPQKYSQHEALDTIKRLQGTHYDPDVVMALSKLVSRNALTKAASQQQFIPISQLQPGMVLKQNLYNARQMLLLPKGHSITESSLQKLTQYQRKHNEQLQIVITGLAGSALDEEE